MNNFKKIVSLIFIANATLGQLCAQETLQNDPLIDFKKFFEVGLALNRTRVNTNYTQFNTSNGVYNFKKNNYLPTIDASFNYGWLMKTKKDKTLFSIKTGLNVINRRANLFDSVNNDLRLSTAYLQIPIQIGFRSPLKYNTVKNNLYRAIEVNFGLYTTTPVIQKQKLDHPDNLDSKGTEHSFNYFRFGFLGEVVYTALDKKGHGHKFGLKYSNDFKSILKIKETENELYPYYITIGLFYNISNNYK